MVIYLFTAAMHKKLVRVVFSLLDSYALHTILRCFDLITLKPVESATKWDPCNMVLTGSDKVLANVCLPVYGPISTEFLSNYIPVEIIFFLLFREKGSPKCDYPQS